MEGADEPTEAAPTWRSPGVWAKPDGFEGNPVRQLIVPASAFKLAADRQGQLEVRNSYGSWPASTTDRPLDRAHLWVRLPIGTQPGDSLRRASWNTPHVMSRIPPSKVLDSYRDAFSFTESGPGEAGLRSPQLGALHAVLGYWTTKRSTPATVVMPTGTGKTETMLALLVAARPRRLLVMVPSDALREQISAKFETLGVLQELGIVSASALRPIVGRLEHGFTTTEAAETFAEACNVIVATPASLQACEPTALNSLLESCSHLFIDEAHHVAARTWSDVRRAFEHKPVVQFTATPFREDGKHLQGRTIYSFPLREAQAQGYFSHINYTAVIDFTDVDEALAVQSVAQLRDDLAAGRDHVLMARVRGIERAKQVLPYYESVAPDLMPVIVNSLMPKGQQQDALKALRGGTSKIIVCVNMLGEGFDLPALKIAAVHDPQKSLGVTLQFIGRFARTSSAGDFGDASMFVARKEIEIDRRLRTLYAEDADWNHILRELTETAVEEQQAVSDFEEGFSSLPDEVTVRSLLPKMSTVVYRAPSRHWEPHNIVDFFGEDNLLTTPIGLNSEAGVAWCVVEDRSEVRWGDLKTIEEVSYQLYVLYFDRAHRLLYINNSANDGVFEDLAVAVLGPRCRAFHGLDCLPGNGRHRSARTDDCRCPRRPRSVPAILDACRFRRHGRLLPGRGRHQVADEHLGWRLSRRRAHQHQRIAQGTDLVARDSVQPQALVRLVRHHRRETARHHDQHRQGDRPIHPARAHHPTTGRRTAGCPTRARSSKPSTRISYQMSHLRPDRSASPLPAEAGASATRRLSRRSGCATDAWRRTRSTSYVLDRSSRSATG